MKFFIPITAKGEQLKSALFWLFKLSWVWPMDPDSSGYWTLVVNCLALLFLSCFFGTVYAEFLFITEHEGDIAKIAECLCTTFVGTQLIIRILHLIVRRNQMRDVLQKFYREIYLHNTEDEKRHNDCESNLRLVYFMSITFFLTLFFMYLSVAIVVARDPTSRSKPYLYQMQFSYDSQLPWNYAFTTLYTGWVGISTVTIISAEDCLIGITLRYCEMRYTMLHEDLEKLYETSLKSLVTKKPTLYHQTNDLYKIFNQKLKVIIGKQQGIDRFFEDLKSFLSIPIFFVVTFGVFLLCTVAFQLQKNDLSVETLKYFFWLVSQCLEFLVIGFFGQRCTDAAAKMADSYYMCNWESLLIHNDSKTNAKLIRDITFAIYRSQKSVHLNGMNFMILSLDSIGSAMSSSVSYFMFLNTMEDISNKKNANK
uniref:Odorant receptor n=1 Tax=Scaeva pyrastri TaxID=219539 RepID=A0A1B3B7A4_SCAPY|nr:putative odorant receptor OR26 [Scaeva pyrastri]